MGDAGCFVFLLGLAGIVVCIYTVPRMVLDGVLSGAEGILIACGMVLLIVFSGAFWQSSPRTSAALLLLFILSLGCLPYVRYVLRDRVEWAIAHEDIRRFEKALAFDPNLNPARVSLGDTYRELGLYDKAVSYYEAALEREPKNKAAHRGLEECLKMQSVARGETWLCHICQVANDPRDTKCFHCATPRSSPPAGSPVHRLSPWAYGALATLTVLLMLLGVLGPFGGLGIALLLSGVFYTLYHMKTSSDA
ncbi:MAG: tetratricopeptide repeat protein [Acidobacteriota bacterium]|nr:tetratricopeptide repeat protein [Acidobacteriota bacterium]